MHAVYADGRVPTGVHRSTLACPTRRRQQPEKSGFGSEAVSMRWGVAQRLLTTRVERPARGRTTPASSVVGWPRGSEEDTSFSFGSSTRDSQVGKLEDGVWKPDPTSVWSCRIDAPCSSRPTSRSCANPPPQQPQSALFYVARLGQRRPRKCPQHGRTTVNIDTQSAAAQPNCSPQLSLKNAGPTRCSVCHTRRNRSTTANPHARGGKVGAKGETVPCVR